MKSTAISFARVGASIALGALLMLAGARSVLAATTWIMASGNPESSYFTQNIRQFIDEVEERSAGELRIDLRANDTLIKHDAIKRAVQTGQVQIGEIRPGVYGNEDPMYILDSIPGVASDYEQARQLLEAQLPYFEDLLGRQGLRALVWAPWPGQGFFTTSPLESLDDMRGKKIRIYSQPTQQMAERLGFRATILPFAEVSQAYATGMIDSLFTSPQTGIDVQIWDYAKHFTYTGTMHNKNAVIVNERAFRSLDEDLQRIVLEAGQRATERGWEMSRRAGAENDEVIESHGVVITDASDDIQQAITAIGDEMLAEWRESAAAPAVEALDRYLVQRSAQD